MRTISADRMSDSMRRSHPLARLVELLGWRRGPTYRMAPPLRNAHYLGLHIAAASRASALDA